MATKRTFRSILGMPSIEDTKRRGPFAAWAGTENASKIMVKLEQIETRLAAIETQLTELNSGPHQ